MPDPAYSGRYTQSFAIVPSDTKQVVGPKAADGQAITSTKGIHALTSGTVVARFCDDRGNGGPPASFAVIAGTLYPYGLTYVYTTTTATLMGLL